MAKKRKRKSELRDATARLIMSRAESWGKTFAAMADIANQMEEEWRKAGGRATRTRRRADADW